MGLGVLKDDAAVLFYVLSRIEREERRKAFREGIMSGAVEVEEEPVDEEEEEGNSNTPYFNAPKLNALGYLGLE